MRDGQAVGRAGGQGVILSEAKDRVKNAPPTRSFAPLRITSVAVVAFVAFAFVHPLAAQLHGQRWDVTPETDRATVGDTITLRFRVRLDERDLLFDTVPKPARTPPDWLRIFAVEKLQRQPDRIYTGRARIAFYRPGRQAVPIFELPFMRSVKGLSRGTFSSDSAFVEIVPVLQNGASATLRDIKEPAPAQGPYPLELVLALGALALAGWLTWRPLRRTAGTVPVSAAIPAAPPPPPDPYDVALARLAEIDGERWASLDVARHYEAVTGALRDYLETLGVPARERTTSELRWALPPGLLAGGTRRRFEDVFEDADLVKFARRRPDAAAAAAFLGQARELLVRWRNAVTAPEALDAVR